MFNNNLKNKFSFTTSFFEAATNKTVNRMSHAFMLTGSDPVAQYQIAMNVAKILNCENYPDVHNCNCINCSWIKQNRHPAVITISPIDYTMAKEGKSKTVISIEQARYLKNSLATSSNYHRVIIFMDAVEGSEYKSKYNELNEDYLDDIISPPQIDVSSEEERIWIPQPLTYKVFNAAAANSLLKTIEEPGNNTTFFFLTKDKEDMISTIVSRCQVIPATPKEIKRYSTDILAEFLNTFPPKTELDAILASEKFIEISKNENISVEILLNSFQEHIRQIIILNAGSKQTILHLTKLIKKIEQTKKEIINYVNINAALESLFFSMVKDNI